VVHSSVCSAVEQVGRLQRYDHILIHDKNSACLLVRQHSKRQADFILTISISKSIELAQTRHTVLVLNGLAPPELNTFAASRIRGLLVPSTGRQVSAGQLGPNPKIPEKRLKIVPLRTASVAAERITEFLSLGIFVVNSPL